jgi:hypothetical protein
MPWVSMADARRNGCPYHVCPSEASALAQLILGEPQRRTMAFTNHCLNMPYYDVVLKYVHVVLRRIHVKPIDDRSGTVVCNAALINAQKRVHSDAIRK